MNISCRQGIILLTSLITLTISISSAMSSAHFPDNEALVDMARANTEFGILLHRQCGAQAEGKSIFYAPFSISTALAMTCLGAHGQTAEVMKKVLQWTQDIPTDGFGSYLPLLNKAADTQSSAAGYVLMGAQRIYVNGRLSLKTNFSTQTQKYFASQAETANFTTDAEGERKKINNWVLEQTKNKISELLPSGSVNALTAMVLVQALYFKGSWKHKFQSEYTRPADFHTPQGPVQVDMMMQKREFDFGRSEKLDCTAVMLPYASNSGSGGGGAGRGGGGASDLSMLILLPNARDGLQKLESTLTQELLKKLMSSMHSVEVDLKMPRFSVESSFSLKQALSSMGMQLAFSDTADFSGMINENEPLQISDVFHKAVVEVNEEGSEAAAATAVVMMLGCSMGGRPRPVPFIVDHPFLFFIVDQRSDVVLFSGRLVNPPRSQ